MKNLFNLYIWHNFILFLQKEEVIKLLQDKIRMAKAKLLQVTAVANNNMTSVESQYNKSLLANAATTMTTTTAAASKTSDSARTPEVASYEIYHHSKTKSSSTGWFIIYFKQSFFT